jgi:integrase
LSLQLAPKSRSHIRGLLYRLWDFAIWSDLVMVQVNPMSFVTIKDCTKRNRQPRSLTVGEFQLFLGQLSDPFHTIALLSVCFGFRISECLALRWSDIDWLGGKLSIERSIVRQNVDEVKTVCSGRKMSLDAELMRVLSEWRQRTQFSENEDWVFASPSKLGRLPWSYPAVLIAFQRASMKAGIGNLGTHTMRHSYRSWLDAVGTGVGVQQKLMRHSDIRTTMNIYGDVVTDEMSEAHSKVVRLAISRAN